MLVSNIAEIKAVMPIGAANNFDRLKTHLESAEMAFIRPLLGNTMFEELEEFHETPPTGTLTKVQEDTFRLLKKVQHAEVHLAYYIGFDLLNVSVSDMGFMRQESTTSKSLFKYQEDNLRDYFKTNGFNALDDVLLFIEENITSFNEFKASPNYTVLKSAFIPGTSTFHDIFFIHNSRLTFLRLIPHMKYVEEIILKPVLTPTVYATIKAGMIAATIPAEVVSVLPFIRPPLAFLSAALLMEESGADMSERGLFFKNTMPNNQDNRQIIPSDADRVAMLVDRARKMGNIYLEALKSYLIDNWTGFSGAAGPFRRDNTDKKSFWV